MEILIIFGKIVSKHLLVSMSSLYLHFVHLIRFLNSWTYRINAIYMSVFFSHKIKSEHFSITYNQFWLVDLRAQWVRVLKYFPIVQFHYHVSDYFVVVVSAILWQLFTVYPTQCSFKVLFQQNFCVDIRQEITFCAITVITIWKIFIHLHYLKSVSNI